MVISKTDGRKSSQREIDHLHKLLYRSYIFCTKLLCLEILESGLTICIVNLFLDVTNKNVPNNAQKVRACEDNDH